MSSTIDCLFIGHNEMSFVDYEKRVGQMGINSGAYRDLNKNFIWYNDIPYPVPGIFNLFNPKTDGTEGNSRLFTLGDSFHLAIAHLGTYLHRRDFSIDSINDFQLEKELLAEKLSRDNILAVVITTTFYITIFPIMEIVKYIRKFNPKAKIIIGGPFIAGSVRSLESLHLEYLFKTMGADIYVNSSQGESTLTKIIRALKENLPLSGVENIYFKEDGKFRATSIERENNSLAENMVDWDLFSHLLTPVVNVRASISCPYSCAFCGFPQHAGPYQTVGVEEVQEGLNRLDKIDVVESVQFIDDTLNVPVKRFKNILKMIIKNDYKFQWHGQIRCQYVDDEMAELMKESKCEGVFLGIESGSNKILANMNKAADVDEYYRGIQLLKKYGIVTYGNFIIGFPGENHETVQETIRFITQSGLDFFRAQIWYCDPLTPIWNKREEYRIQNAQFEWTHATMDAKIASEITDDIFLSVSNPQWVPQYNFEFEGLLHLIHRGLSWPQVKQFLKAFNQGLKEKLHRPSVKNTDSHIINQLKRSLEKSDEEE
jgi:anaerobic magnesium-protoporphyrin IX monomethyl ester cyclase